MREVFLSALLAGIALPAMAADMPRKAPRPAEAIISDWSGIYAGIEGGYGWGRQKWDGTSTFGGGDVDVSQTRIPSTGFPALVFTSRVFLPDFDIPLTSSLKNR